MGDLAVRNGGKTATVETEGKWVWFRERRGQEVTGFGREKREGKGGRDVERSSHRRLVSIGYSLAKEFLKSGDNVVICSRSTDGVESAVQSLREEFGEQHVWVAEYLVPNIRSIIANGSMKPTYIRFLTVLKAYTKIFSVK
ncbi:hypothetical protein FNV43_RR25452 [Rhamnella rubrinervis]|uniref:Uncharacterized protein n=1 Tax=Rhamnella rubrinervis TaxID=2594499 RepID=A0A8K0GQ40_9ROSA|nr:hypothetical protein FNV43_RR25452 [Rhamnella rubrinervis]